MNNTIIFYYKKRAIIINEAMLNAFENGNHNLIELINRNMDKIPENNIEILDPKYDENVPYIITTNNPESDRYNGIKA